LPLGDRRAAGYLFEGTSYAIKPQLDENDF
jgi:hypothetical protein